MRLIVPSRGRAELLAREFPYVEHAHVVVDEDQADDYGAALDHRGREALAVVAIPAGGATAGDLYNLCLDAVWDSADVDACFFLHDTTQCITSLVGHEETRLSTEDALDVLRGTCRSAAESGTGVCGLGSMKPAEFRSFTPVSVVADINWEAIGICDRALRFDTNARGCGDTEICLRAVLRYGSVWRDNRYRVRGTGDSFVTGIAESAAYLREKFQRYGGGRVIDVKPKPRGADGWTKRVRFDQIRAEGP